MPRLRGSNAASFAQLRCLRQHHRGVRRARRLGASLSSCPTGSSRGRPRNSHRFSTVQGMYPIVLHESCLYSNLPQAGVSRHIGTWGMAISAERTHYKNLAKKRSRPRQSKLE